MQPTRSLRPFGFLSCLLLACSSLHAGNWPQWRGPAGDSASDERGLPLTWSADTENVRRTPLPQWGTSTPAIWGDAVFVTSDADGKLLLLRIDKQTGEVVWTRHVGIGTAPRKQEGAGNRTAKFHDLHNLASPSPVTDGERVIVHFGTGLLASYTFDGELEWSRNLTDDFGPYTIWWGHANSPVLYRDLVISVCMQDSMKGEWESLAPSYVVAHDKRTGKPVWKTMRMTAADAEQCDSYTTPVLRTAGGQTELIIMGGNQLDAYDPATGGQLWSLPGLVGGRTITGPTLSDGVVFTTVGMRGPLHAVDLDQARGELSDEAVLWKQSQSTPDTCCPVVANGLVFVVTDNGIASCFDAETGEMEWRERLPDQNYKASPLAAEGRVYFLSREGTCTVVEAAPEFKVLAENRLEDEFLASPAVSDGKLFLRGRTALYTIGR